DPAITHDGEVHLGGGSLPDFAVEVEVPAVLFHEAVGHGHAEAGADADGLGGEERLEHPGHGLRVHPDAGVTQRNADIGSGLDPRVERAIRRAESLSSSRSLFDGSDLASAAVRARIAVRSSLTCCAMAPVSRPMVSIFSACFNARSRASCAATSSAVIAPLYSGASVASSYCRRFDPSSECLT